MRKLKTEPYFSLLLLFSFLLFPISSRSQVRPVYDYGAVGLGQLLKRLQTTKSVMHIGAHPDDEDSGLLAFLARGENARTAYLSLTRGDGGQNILGAELFESLGVIRTEELLQARRLDGAEQYFTRAFDYGFSKTLDEAKQKWDEKAILCDAVRAIRLFRPLVVISRFSGTPADGHGQHQFAGYIAPLAVKAASDAKQCKDAGEPWQVLKFYVSQGFRSTAQPTLKLDTGKYDYLLGRSFFEIAMEGRSQHKTQEQGVLELKGEKFSGLNLIESNVPKVENERSVFDGIDASLTNIPNLFGKDEKSVSDYTKSQLNLMRQFLERAIKQFDPNDPRPIAPILVEGRKAANQLAFSYIAFSGTPERRQAFQQRIKNEAEIAFIVWEKLREFTKALKLAAGVQLETLVERETVAPGENFLASVKVFYPENTNIKVKEIKLNAPQNWQISSADEPKNDPSSPLSAFFREKSKEAKFFNVKVSPTAKLTQPYFLESPRDGYQYVWNETVNQTLPFQYPAVNGSVLMEIYGETIPFNQFAEFRFADDVRGEIRRDLNVAPKISLRLDQSLLIVPQSDKPQTRRIRLNIFNNSPQKAVETGTADLKLPKGWQTEPKFGTFQLNKKGENFSLDFDALIPANVKAGEYEIKAEARIGDEIFTQTMNEIAYPHIQTHRFYTNAEAKVRVLDLKIAPVTVGYVAGSGDAVAEAIRRMGFSIESLNEADLASGDLSRYDTIVVGIRASEARRDFVANHERLLEYVKTGGTLVVQYQRPVYKSLLPFPAEIGARVVDETAPVAILEPQHPVFNFPNKITEKDFAGWVQERNLYSLTNFDARYEPLLEARDAGEAENKGGLVIAEIGKGRYVYTSYAFFRQLPAGVPGAYRLFANLLSLPKAKKQN